jgi:asparagine synthase (glutamine-hydrolysing)
MCGIAGIFFFAGGDHRGEVKETVASLLGDLTHRGPDDTGEIAVPAFGMGTTRLAIIDISGGHQPMTAAGGRYSICFNGEIYNYRQIRSALIEVGCVFQTESDTEVILQGYLKWGEKVLDRLEGMFAVAIYDAEHHELLLARDRLGKKPLYYYRDADRLIFCSEVQAIARLDGIRLNVNAQSYWDFLTYRYIPGTATAYERVFKVERGHFYRVSASGMEATLYWRIPREADETAAPPPSGNSARRFGELFATAVEKRLVADVPVSVVLSGGIDSCAVLMEASKHKTIDSYHVHFPSDDEDFNELKYAELMAKRAGSTLHVVEATEQAFFDQLLDIAAITDEPLADLASVPFKMVCDLAAKDLKVVLSGEGADEVLAGYGYHHLPRRLDRLGLLQKLPRPALGILRKIMETACGRPLKIFDEVDVPLARYGKNLNHNITFQMDHGGKLDLLAGDHHFEDSARFLDDEYDAIAAEDPLNQILHVISGAWLVEDVLMKSDKVSMSASLEVRCPFLDHDLVEFLFRLPGKSKVGKFNGQFESKVLLRRYLDGKVPEEILSRRKFGFPVPVYSLHADRELDFMHDILGTANCFYPQILNRDAVMGLLASVKEARSSVQSSIKHFLWSIAIYEIWFRGKACGI